MMTLAGPVEGLPLKPDAATVHVSCPLLQGLEAELADEENR